MRRPRVRPQYYKDNIELSNKFQIFGDYEDDDMALVEALASSGVTMPVSTKNPLLIHVFYCNYTATKKVILADIKVHRDTTFQVLFNNLVIRAANITEYTKITEYLRQRKLNTIHSMHQTQTAQSYYETPLCGLRQG